jgi:hypothetical protein
MADRPNGETSISILKSIRITHLAHFSVLSICPWMLLAGCSKESPQLMTTAPNAEIHLAPSSTWKIERSGSAPVLRAARGTTIHLFSEHLEADQHQLPGVTIGDASGPRFGLLSGHFAPIVVFPDSTRDWPLAITSTSALLHIRAGAEIAIDVAARPKGGAEMTLRGAPFVAVPADRTEVRGTIAEASSFALSITAGEKPGIIAPRADRIETRARGEQISLASKCERPLLIRLTPRGSTSVFLIRYGPVPTAKDPLLFAESTDERTDRACPSTATSTLTVEGGA